MHLLWVLLLLVGLHAPGVHALTDQFGWNNAAPIFAL